MHTLRTEVPGQDGYAANNSLKSDYEYKSKSACPQGGILLDDLGSFTESFDVPEDGHFEFLSDNDLVRRAQLSLQLKSAAHGIALRVYETGSRR